MIANLGKGVPTASRQYLQQIKTMRENMVHKFLRNIWSEGIVRLKTLKLQLAQQTQMKKLILAKLNERQFSGEALLLANLGEGRPRAEPELKHFLFWDTVIHDLANESPNSIAKRIEDKSELVRILAIKTAAKKWLPLERKLIKALADASADVRKAAHEALVRLSRGNDFGPSSSSEAAIRSAQKRWTTWLELQRTDMDIIEVKR